MLKKIIAAVSLFFLISSSSVFAQHSLIYTTDDKNYIQGKEFFEQQKFGASYRYFEEFLKNTVPVQAGQREEAEYYLAASAYELRKENALPLLQNFLSEHPYTLFADPLHLMLGVLYCEQKNFSLSAYFLNQVDEQNLAKEKIPDFLFYKGYVSIQNKQLETAKKCFAQLKSLNSSYNTDAVYYYAYCEYLLGNYREALPGFLSVESQPEYQSTVPYFLVQIYYAEKQYDKLKEKADYLLLTYPENVNNAEIYRILGEMAYTQKNYEQAIYNLKKYESLFPQVLRNDMYLLGLSYFQMKDYTNAVAYLSKVTTTADEISENAYLHLGTSYIHLNDKTNARLAYEAALQTNFNPSVREEAMFNYALTCYETTSAFGESIAAFSRFLSEFPNSKYADEAYQYLTSVYLTTKNYELAYQSIQKIKNLNASLRETKQYLLYQLGVDAFTQQNYEKAIDYFTLSLENSSTGKYAAESLFWRSECFYRTNQITKAIKDLETFVKNPLSKSSKNLTKAYYSLGYAYFGQQNYSKATDWLLKYLETETDAKSILYADALNRLGDCYFYSRNFKNAREYYEKAADAAPGTADYSVFQAAYAAGLQKNYLDKIYRLEELLVKYPNSEYADDALYEIGRSYLMLKNEKMALSTYQRLMESFPNSALARKAALEYGMIYFNRRDYENAVSAFKKVIEQYPGTQEAYVALETMESAYVEMNDVNGFVEYTKKTGQQLLPFSSQREDSISYIAAEKQYMNEKYEAAIAGMENYLAKFCPGGRYCTMAQYYLANSYYQTKQREKALSAFQTVLKNSASEYVEEAALRCAEITYDQKDFAAALNFFKQLESLAQTSANKQAARLGVLRCSYYINDYQTIINIANEILADTYSDQDMMTEARFYRAKAYLAMNQAESAIPDLKTISAETRTIFGAESKYLLASVYFQQGKLAESENEIMDFAKKNTPHQFWLARSFVLLADIYIQKGNDFQAKQYLLSLQRNYTAQDEIQELISQRLTAIGEREKKKIIN
jgi:TolA-binding protein